MGKAFVSPCDETHMLRVVTVTGGSLRGALIASQASVGLEFRRRGEEPDYDASG